MPAYDLVHNLQRSKTLSKEEEEEGMSLLVK